MKIGKGRRILYEFSEVFEALLCSAVTEGHKNKEVVVERYKVLNQVFDEISELTGTEPKLKLFPNFASGGVVIEVPEIHLDKAKVLKLKEILSKCNTFEITPLLDGRIRAAVTVKGVFESSK